MIIQLCQRSSKRGHAVATVWVERAYLSAYSEREVRQTLAYCSACASEDERVVNRLGPVVRSIKQNV